MLAARLGDPVLCPADVHGAPPFPIVFTGVTGYFDQGSPDTLINDRPAIRLGDGGPHVACCGPNRFVASSGANQSLINDRPAIRMLDATTHCGVSPGFVLPGMTSPNTPFGL